MESEFLSIIHIIKPITKRDNNLVSKDTALFSYVIDPLLKDEIENAFSFLFTQEVTDFFTITLMIGDFTGMNYDFFLEKFCLILSHPFYFKEQDRPVIHVDGLLTGDKQTYLEKLNIDLEQHGFQDLLFINASDEKESSFIFFNNNISDVDFKEWYFKHLLKSQSVINIFTVSDNFSSTERLTTLRDEADDQLRSTDPAIYSLLKQLQLKSAEASKYRSANKLSAETLSSKEIYLEYVLGKYKNGDDVNLNEIMKLKKFYYNEYEILPLWYKRFGHILKVMLGKRTFRSLFNDNVKKYKD